MLGELVGIVIAGDDVPENLEARDPGDVTHDDRQLDIHLHERFLHPLDVAAGTLDQRLAMADIRA